MWYFQASNSCIRPELKCVGTAVWESFSYAFQALSSVQWGLCIAYCLLFLYIGDLKQNKSTERKTVLLQDCLSFYRPIQTFNGFHTIQVTKWVNVQQNYPEIIGRKNKASGDCYVKNRIVPEHTSISNFSLKKENIFFCPYKCTACFASYHY